jgi:hypothetical protein
MVVFLLPQILCEVFRVVSHFLDGSLLHWELRALVRGIVFELLLKHWSWSSQAVETEEVVNDMVVEPNLVEEDVVFLGHVLTVPPGDCRLIYRVILLEKLGNLGCRIFGRGIEVDDARVFDRQVDLVRGSHILGYWCSSPLFRACCA